jgi:hypothetical protein
MTTKVRDARQIAECAHCRGPLYEAGPITILDCAGREVRDCATDRTPDTWSNGDNHLASHIACHIYALREAG